MAEAPKENDNTVKSRDKKTDQTTLSRESYKAEDLDKWRSAANPTKTPDKTAASNSELVTKKGETINSIAAAALGPHASKAEVDEVARKLENANRYDGDHKFPGGVKLHIPPSLSKLFGHEAQKLLTFTPSDDKRLYGQADPHAARPLTNPFYTPDGKTKPSDTGAVLDPKGVHNNDAPADRPPMQHSDGGTLSPADGYSHLDRYVPNADVPAPPIPPALKSADRPTDLAAADQDARALHEFLSDPAKATKLLSTKSDAQRAAIDTQYQSVFSGHSLTQDYSEKISGKEFADFTGALNRKDGDVSSQNADRIFSSLAETNNWFGRSKDQIEKDIRDSARTGDPTQMRQDYMKAHGRDLDSDVRSNTHLSAETKAAFEIYMDRGPNGPDYFALASKAATAKNLDMFSEAMQDQNARNLWNGPKGQAYLDYAFGSNAQKAKDLVEYGKMSTDHQLDAGKGFFGTDTKTVDMSMKLMSPEETSNYFIGKNQTDSTVKLSADDQARLETMTDQQKLDAKTFYDAEHKKLTDLARTDVLHGDKSQADILRWEDMAATKGGSIVGQLQSHWGRITNGGMGEIKDDIATMSQKDWADGRAHPERRQQLEQMLQALNKSPEDYKSTLELYDKKIAESDFAKADRAGRGDVLLEKLDADHRLLALNDRRGVMSDLMDAEKRDPVFRDRLLHPMNDDDRAFAQKFQDKVTGLIGENDYNAIVKPFIEKGSIPLDQAAKFDFTSETIGQQVNIFRNPGDDFKANVKFMVNAIGQASPEDKQRLLSGDPNDKAFQNTVFRDMSPEELQVAKRVAGQKDGVHDEDRLRLSVLHSEGADKIDDAVSSIGVNDKTRGDYASKYSSSLDADALKGASDTTKVERALATDNDAVSKFNQARDEASQTRSGFGDWFASKVYGSAADQQLNDATNQHADMIIAAQNVANNVKPEDLQKMTDTMQTAVDNNKEAKAAAGEAVKNSAIAVGTVAALIVSGGTASVPLAAAFAASGAVLNVGSKKLFQGSDYDPTLGQVGQDLAVGGISGAANAIGPGQFVKVFGFASAAVKDGVASTLASDFLINTKSGYTLAGSELLKEGAAADLNKAATKIMQESLINGEKRLDTKALKDAVEKAIPADTSKLNQFQRQEMISLMTQRLEQNITEQMVTNSQRVFGSLAKTADGQLMNNAQRIGQRVALNGFTGAGASAISSGGEAVVNFDPRKSLGENVGNVLEATITGGATGFLFGAGAGEGFAGAIHGIGKVAPHIKAGVDKITPAVFKDPAPLADSTYEYNIGTHGDKTVAGKSPVDDFSFSPKLTIAGDAIKEAPPRTAINPNDAELSIWPKENPHSKFEDLKEAYIRNRPTFTGRDSKESVEALWQQNKGQLADIIAEKLDSKIMPEATFLSPLKNYTGDHLETARMILDNAATYATDYGIMKSMKNVAEQLESGERNPLQYFVASPDSLSNTLAYTARKVHNDGPKIQYFDKTGNLGKTLGDYPFVIFGDLSKMTAEQKEAFKTAMNEGNGLRAKQISIVDTSAFERLPTAIDYAKGETAVRQKMDALIDQTDRIMKADPNITRAEAVEKAIYGGNSKVIDELNAARGNFAPVNEIRPPVLSKGEIFSQHTSPEDITKFFEGKFKQDAPSERIFAAEMTAFDGKFPSYADMVKGMQTMKSTLDQAAVKNGLDPAKDLYLVNIESGGSSEASMMGLYVAANDIPASQVVTKNQLAEMSRNGLIDSRRVVVLDDAIYSGSQWTGYSNYSLSIDKYPNLAVGTLATYSRYAKDMYTDGLVKAAETNGYSDADTALLKMRYKYGAKAEELSGLKWAQINLENGTLSIKGIPKRPLTAEDRAMFGELKKSSHSEYVFGDAQGARQSEQALSDQIEDMKKVVAKSNTSREFHTNEVLISRNPAHDLIQYTRSPYDYRHTMKSLLSKDGSFGEISSTLQLPGMNADNRVSWFSDFVSMVDAKAVNKPYDFDNPYGFSPSKGRRAPESPGVGDTPPTSPEGSQVQNHEAVTALGKDLQSQFDALAKAAADAPKEIISVDEIAAKLGKVPTAAEFKTALDGNAVGELPKALSETGLTQQVVFGELDKLAKSLRSLDTVLPSVKKSGLGAQDLEMPPFNIKIGDQTVSVEKIGIGEVAHVYKLSVDGQSFAFKVPNDPARMDVHGSFAETGALAYLSSLKPPPADLAKFHAANPGPSGGWMMSDFIDKAVPHNGGDSVAKVLADQNLYLGDNWSANMGPGKVVWDVGGIEPLVNGKPLPYPNSLAEFNEQMKNPAFKMIAGRRLDGLAGNQTDLHQAMLQVLTDAPEAAGQVARSVGLLKNPYYQYDILSHALKIEGAAGRAAFELDRMGNKFYGESHEHSYAARLFWEAMQSPAARVEAAKQIDKLPVNERYDAFKLAWQYPEARPMAAKSIPSIPNSTPPEGGFTYRELANTEALTDPGARYIITKSQNQLSLYLKSKGLTPDF